MPMVHISPKYWLTVLVFFILSACSNSTNDKSNNTNSEQSLEPMAVSGIAAWGAAAQFAQICTLNQTTEFCTRADARGQYILKDMSAYNSLIKADIIDGSGNDVTYFSLYDMPEGDINAFANVNELTDIITQAYLADTNLSASQCYATPSCTTNIQENINASRLENIINGMQILLGDFWPVNNNEPINPFTEPYDTQPSNIPMNTDGLIEMLDFDIDGAGLLTVSSLLSGVIANIPLEQLALSTNADFLTTPSIVDVVSTGEALTDISNTQFSTFTAAQSPVQVSAIFSSSNQELETPVEITLTVITSVNPIDDYVTDWTAQLYGPDGSFYTWSRNYLDTLSNSRTLTITSPGLWNFSAIATSVSGIKGIGGLTFRIGSNVTSIENATWGDSGRCTPNWTNFNNNSLNLCLEQLNGGEVTTLPECIDGVDFKEEVGRCSIINQFQDATMPSTEASTLRDQALFLGHCSNLTTETRYYHYINPLTNNSDTFSEAKNRAAILCIFSGGTWNVP